MMYYTYMYIDSRTNEPFYVGKGKNERAFCHWEFGAENKRFNNRLKTLKKLGITPIIHLMECSNERTAYELEIGLIKQIGRKDLGSGPLYNYTNGGDGCSGGPDQRLVQTKKETQRKRLAYWTVERRARQANIARGNTNRRGRKELDTSKKKELVKCPHCSVISAKVAMNRWHFNNCRYKVTSNV
jgi:hypothetical protein